ncbi:MAG: hypothetical protein ACETWQ_08105 [Phycisphaerae bacterium]
MKLIRRKIFIRWVSVLICGMLMFSSSQMLVLCKGEDGHTAVEIVSSDCCNNLLSGVFREASVTSAKEQFTSKNKCGACADIPISVGFATAIRKSDQVNPVVPASTTISLVNISSPDFSEYQLVLEPFTPTHYFTPLRSIILLI